MIVSAERALVLISIAASAVVCPSHAWQLVDGRSWQIVSAAVEEPEATDAAEGTRGACRNGMVEIAGMMKRDGDASVEELQKRACTKWIRREFPERCAVYDEAMWRALASPLATKPMRFCIDRFEYPNRRGAFPMVLVDWNEAAAHCADERKRLCSEDEWTFACEGEAALPYPYGYARDAEACVIDRPYRSIEGIVLFPRAADQTAAELDRLWQGEASGARARCRSPFGVYDMTGNVDEWTVSTHAGGFRSILKGGYWGPIRARCRPSTRAHGETFAFYQQGFRCCADLP